MASNFWLQSRLLHLTLPLGADSALLQSLDMHQGTTKVQIRGSRPRWIHVSGHSPMHSHLGKAWRAMVVHMLRCLAVHLASKGTDVQVACRAGILRLQI